MEQAPEPVLEPEGVPLEGLPGDGDGVESESTSAEANPDHALFDEFSNVFSQEEAEALQEELGGLPDEDLAERIEGAGKRARRFEFLRKAAHQRVHAEQGAGPFRNPLVRDFFKALERAAAARRDRSLFEERLGRRILARRREEPPPAFDPSERPVIFR